MRLVCFDLEGVLVPKLWIAFPEVTNIPEFQRTTLDEPDHDKLMRYHLDLFAKHNLNLPDIQKVLDGLEPFPGAAASGENSSYHPLGYF